MRLASIAALLSAALGPLIPVHAQTVVPVGPKFPPLAGLTFDGQWECKSGDLTLTARLRVTPDRARHGESMPSAQGRWTQLTETQQGIAAHYLVGYDRDANEFLLLDADDPAYEVFRPEGWSGPTITLTYVAPAGQTHADKPVRLSRKRFGAIHRLLGRIREWKLETARHLRLHAQFPPACSREFPIALSPALTVPCRIGGACRIWASNSWKVIHAASVLPYWNAPTAILLIRW